MSESTAFAQGMAVPGKAAVNETGAATYEVAITVSPGTAGMIPSLSLTYNSQSGNGLLGMGWQLEGLPSVARCPRTMAQDGVRGGINYDANDRFCLDGQRLLAISGTYGADGTEYRTEIESFAKIISRGSAGTGPAWFEVRTKTGQTMEFGNSADSRILAQGKVEARSWGVSKVLDTKGNYYTISYVNDTANGEAYPSRIDYAGNSGAGLAPYNSVRFVYTTTRPDWTLAYHAGSMLRSTARLANIQTYAGQTLVADYQLSYAQGTSTGRSQLTSITLCAGGTCLPATSFTWQQGGSGSLSFTKYDNPTSIESDDHWLTVDIDGNGVSDLMTYDINDGENYWYLNQGVVNGQPRFTVFTNLIPPWNAEALAPQFGDWNRDGRTDVMVWNGRNGTNRWWVNNGIQNGTPSFTLIPSPINTSLIDGGGFFTGDWNGDGLTDAAWVNSANGRNLWFINTGIVNGTINFSLVENPIPTGQLQGYELNMGDWNGDGFADLMTHQEGSGTNRWFVNNGMANGTLNFAITTNAIPTGDVDGDSRLLTGDFNGDGLTDLAWKHYGTSRWFLSKGVSNGVLAFTPMSQPIPNVGDSVAWEIYSGDWNDDGFSDVMAFLKFDTNGDNRWFVSKSGRWSEPFAETTNPIATGDIDDDTIGHGAVFGDWDGNGSTDALFSDDSANRWFINQRAKPDILTQITTGVGATTSITYKVLTDSTIYRKDESSTYPIADLQGPMQVVSRVDQSNGIGGLRSVAYTYAGAKLHLDGRGFLGFREIKATDQQTGITQTTSYRQDFPFNGFIASETRTRNGGTLSSTSNTYEARDLGGSRRHVFLSQSFATAVDLDGSALPSVSSTYQYDTYGNATQITVTHSDGYSKTTTNAYTNDTTNWLLGRLTAASVTSTAPAANTQAPPADSNPDPFDFTDVNNATTGTLYETSAVVTGFNRPPRTASVSGGEAQMRKNGTGTWGSSVGVFPGDTINLRMRSSNAFATAVTTVVTLGSRSADWRITTEASDQTPNAFDFVDVTAPRNSLQEASALVTGFDGPLTATISGPNAQIRKNASGAWEATVAVNSGDTLNVRMSASNAYSSSNTAVITLGSATVDWKVTSPAPASMVFGPTKALTRTLVTSSPGTIRFTYSLWIKFSALDSVNNMPIWQVINAPTNSFWIVTGLKPSQLVGLDQETPDWGRQSNSSPAIGIGAWHHLVFRYDSSESSSGNRIRIYQNGVLLSGTANRPAPGLNVAQNLFANGRQHQIGAWLDTPRYLIGKMAFITVVDGQSLAPDSFAFSNGGVWTHKPYAAGFGPYGFFLDGSTGVLGQDLGPNGQTFTGLNMNASSLDTFDVPPNGLSAGALAATNNQSTPDQLSGGVETTLSAAPEAKSDGDIGAPLK